ncbi:hypothetical protein CPB86DRAFT_576350 [Serendipita vermifera]|nr:hypothetical protein CPB86DRAFT_576350 [Serendipita vermifera]
MSHAKRPRSPTALSEAHAAKRQRLSGQNFRRKLTFDLALADELVLVIFGYLQAADLCRAERVSQSWKRLAVDNELWKALFQQAFGRLRLRGARSTLGTLNRSIKPLRNRQLPDIQELPPSYWKGLYRVARNWQTGRNVTQISNPLGTANDLTTAKPLVLLLGKGAAITSAGCLASSPEITITQNQWEMTLRSSKTGIVSPIRVSSFALNQVISAELSTCLAVFYSTEKKFSHLSVFHVNTELKAFKETFIITPKVLRGPISHSAYHSNLLISLSSTFQVDIYQIPSNSGSKPVLVRTVSSFSSFPPSSLTICRPNPLSHKVLLSYAVPVYPKHWSVATTELHVDEDADISSTRTLRAYQAKEGPASEAENFRRAAAGRMPAVTSVQSDGRHLVVAPQGENYMELYRLRQSSLAFVKILFGPVKSICAIAVADGRCVCISLDGVIWIYDLDGDWGVEVQDKIDYVDETNTQLYFDDRRIVVTTPTHIQTISFD